METECIKGIITCDTPNKDFKCVKVPIVLVVGRMSDHLKNCTDVKSTKVSPVAVEELNSKVETEKTPIGEYTNAIEDCVASYIVSCSPLGKFAHDKGEDATFGAPEACVCTVEPVDCACKGERCGHIGKCTKHTANTGTGGLDSGFVTVH